MGPTSRAVAAALALAFLALHLPYTPRSLEDVDSINFALGIRDFDVAEHQPHPPGYPVFILIAKAVNAVTNSEVLTLSLVGIVSGALLAFVLVALFRALGDPERVALHLPERVALQPWTSVAAAALALAAPLMWITAARPLSDVPGLAAALFVQWLLVRGRTVRELAFAALAAGLAAGIRSQVVWLTVPLFLLIVVRNRAAWRLEAALSIAGAYAAGALIWAVPLLMLSGGPAGYWREVAFQGGADLSGVTMLWTNPTPRQLLAAFQYAFLHPWGWWPLGAAVLVCAAAGGIRLLRTAPIAAATLAAAFGPYLIFDVLFQETVTTRYALPLVVPAAWLAAIGLAAVMPRWGGWAVAGLAAVALAVAQPTLIAYASEAAPAFRMLADMRAETGRSEPPVLAVHRRQDFDLRRPLKWMGADAPVFSSRLAAPPRLEWLELVDYWNSGGRGPAWFVTDPARSDLALVHHGAPHASYRWPLRFRELIGGVRPNEMDWYALGPPAWYLGEGWSLTPEAAGVAVARGKGPASGGSEGWIRRTADPLTLVLGGRLLPGGPETARLRVSLDGRIVAEPEIGRGFFLRILDFPAKVLAGEGDYAALVVRADSDRVALEQFDAQPAGQVLYGFGEGWHEHEYDPATGELWRWTSDRAVIRIRAGGKALSIRIRGLSEAGREVNLKVRAGETVVVNEAVGPSFAVNATVPASALGTGDSVITIETDGAFVPAEVRWRTQDRRRLGLKILECLITPAS